MKLKQIQKLTALLILVAFLLSTNSCKKTCDPPKEYAFKKVIQNGLPSIGHSISKSGPATLTFGIYFRPNINGKVTELSCMMPTNGIYNVVLWDSSSATILANENITQSDTLTGGVKAITPVNISTDKTYIITGTVDNQQWYGYRRVGSPLRYPYVSDNITIRLYKWSPTTSGATPIIPLGQTFGDIAGFADFTFVPK